MERTGICSKSQSWSLSSVLSYDTTLETQDHCFSFIRDALNLPIFLPLLPHFFTFLIISKTLLVEIHLWSQVAYDVVDIPSSQFMVTKQYGELIHQVERVPRRCITLHSGAAEPGAQLSES